MRKLAQRIRDAVLDRFLPVRWVVLDDAFAVYDIARTPAQVGRYVIDLLEQDIDAIVQPIDIRCHGCGEQLGDGHAPKCRKADEQDRIDAAVNA